jgi:hypothetical protein
MNNVRFQEHGTSFGYGRFYVGLGLSATLFLLFSAFLAWYLGVLARNNPKAIGPLGWAFFVLQLVSVGLNWIYISVVPTILVAVLAVVLGCVAWLVSAART